MPERRRSALNRLGNPHGSVGVASMVLKGIRAKANVKMKFIFTIVPRFLRL